MHACIYVLVFKYFLLFSDVLILVVISHAIFPCCTIFLLLLDYLVYETLYGLERYYQVLHGPITIAIDCNFLFLLIFEEKWPNYAAGSKYAPSSDSFWVRRLFKYMRACFLCPKCDNYACLHTRQDPNELHLKR